MPSDEFGERTEQPTDRRRQEARQKGNVARSMDLTAAGHMLAAAMGMYFLGYVLMQSMADLLRGYLGQGSWLGLDTGFIHNEFWRIAMWTASGVLPLLLFLAAAALAVNFLQVGFLVAPEGLRPKAARLNPIEGAKRIVSLPSLVRLGASLGKLVLLVTIAACFIWYAFPTFLPLTDSEPGIVATTIVRSFVNLALYLAIALIALGLADYGFQKWKFERDLRMTKQEVREELKSMEGDPLIRQRRREAHRKLVQARELRAVQDADVVITNPTHIAIAIKYDPDTMAAPTIVAKGMGEIAERIRKIAAEHRVPIIERKELARLLYRTVQVGHPIPAELYSVFVEIMAYVYHVTKRMPAGLR